MWNKFLSPFVIWLTVWFVIWENDLSKCAISHRKHHSPFLDIHYVRNANEENPDADATHRLPSGSTRPIKYHLKITPNLEDSFIFQGEVKILLIVEKKTKNIYLNSYLLNIKKVELMKGESILPSSFELDIKNQMLIVNMKENLIFRNEYELMIEFSGILNQELIGFYRSSYVNGNQKQWLAVTQFEPTHARMAFPCYDEPEYRAVFSIEICHQSHYKSISNMPLKLTSKPDSNNGERVCDVFEDTPEMSTYLVAFMVGDMAHITNAEGTFTVWAREYAINDARYILEGGPKLQKEMSELVNIPYALPKLDMVSIPDFLGGGMENWGMITYREIFQLYNEKVCPAKSKELIMLTTAHEIVHQWFGNYVTMEWWDYLWLKEGFATYLSYCLVHEVEPSWRMDEFFVLDSMHGSLLYDDVYVHHAMNSKVTSTSEIQNKFNFISYEKGASILRMLEHMVSKDTMKKALNLYLTQQYRTGGTALPEDLWDAIDEQLKEEKRSFPHGLTVKSVMRGWTEFPGYPLITVSRSSNGNAFDVKVKQETYKSSRSNAGISDKEWVVPLTCTIHSTADSVKTDVKMWLQEKEAKLERGMTSAEWILCNTQQTGYYRVNYDNENWQLITKQLLESPNTIPALTKAQLLADTFALALDNKSPFSVFFNLAYYLDKEADALPWLKGIDILIPIWKRFSETQAALPLQNFSRDRIQYIYKSLGFDEKANEEHLIKILRWRVLWEACALKIEECELSVKQEYEKNKDLDDLKPHAKPAIICTMLKTNDEQLVWDKAWNLYQKSNVEYDKVTILRSLGCANDQKLLDKYLFKLLDDNDNDIRPHNYGIVLQSIFSTANGVMAGLKFVERILPDINQYKKGEITMLKVIQTVEKYVKSDNEAKQLQKMIEDSEKRDQTKYGSIIAGLKNAQKSALQSKEVNEKKASEIVAAFENSKYATPKPSFAPALLPSTAVLLITFLVFFSFVNN